LFESDKVDSMRLDAFHITQNTFRPFLVLGVVLLSKMEVSVPPRLLPTFNAGEGGSAEKVEWV